MYINDLILQIEQHEPEGDVAYLLDVTPINSL